jgi:heat-inducible transcriptional repressor
MGDQLSTREEAILLGLLTDFIETREPVASKRLAATCPEGLSSATVRNILSRLEDAGYLAQPHASAGRVPTHRAYRYFIRRALGQADTDGDPDWDEVERLVADGSLNALVREASNTLARGGHSLGFAVTPPLREVRLRSCDLVPMSAGRVLWVVVSQAGQVLQCVLSAPEAYTPEELRWFSNYLSGTYGGWSFAEIRRHLQAQVVGERAECRREVRQALELVAPYFMEAPSQRELSWGGMEWLLEVPWLAGDISTIRGLIDSLQRKSQLLDLLDALAAEGPGLRVVLGDDWPDASSRGLAMVTAPFGGGGAGCGLVGIIGPVALRYDTTIPLVRRVARLATLASERL